jgi:hypothetical protein
VGSVLGSAFVPGERVRVTARTGAADPVAAVVEAGTTGRFAARLHLPSAQCADVFYRAVGALGSRATFTLTAPDCKPK